MFKNEKSAREDLPLYEVTELSMEEALFVLVARKEAFQDSMPRISSPTVVRWYESYRDRSGRLASLSV